MLHELSDRARKSFYFCPSLSLWCKWPTSEIEKCDVEVDALAVVDGRLFMCEAKTSSGLSKGEIEKLVLAAERIRPDVVLLAFSDAKTTKAEAARKALAARLPPGIDVQAMNRPAKSSIFGSLHTYLTTA
jgi:hypothetical protein